MSFDDWIFTMWIVFAVGSAFVLWTNWSLRRLEERYRARHMSQNCPKCRIPFSDWFVWPPGGRYCYPCHDDSGRWERYPSALPLYWAPGESPQELVSRVR